MQVYWSTGVDPGEIFAALGQSVPPLITNQSFSVEVSQGLSLDPSTFPDVQGLIQGWTLDVLTHLSGWQVIVAIFMILYLAQKAFDIVDWVLKYGYRKLSGKYKKSKARRRKPKPSSETPEDSPSTT